MIVRIWRTELAAGREADYERFARERSLPMFQRQDGCLGVLFARTGDTRAAITFWTDQEAVERLGGSEDYQRTVAAIGELLAGEQTVEVFEAELGFAAFGSQEGARS